MKIKPESNNHKILLALYEANKSLSVKILAEMTKIPYSNIHRNLNQLADNNFISRIVSQEGRNRFTYISLTSKGLDFKRHMKSKIAKKPVKISKESQNRAFGEANLPNYDEVSVEPDTIRLGIGFYRDYARGLGIPNYSSLRIPMLKLKIGLTLIKQSNLIDSKAIEVMTLRGAI